MSKIDLVFVIDNSGSVNDNTQDDFTTLLAFCSNITMKMDLEMVRVGMVVFSRTAQNIFYLNTYVLAKETIVLYCYSYQAEIYRNVMRVASLTSSISSSCRYHNKNDLWHAIASVQTMGSFTNTSGAIRTMMRDQFIAYRGDRPDAKNVAIIITDGVSNIDAYRTISDAEAARAAGVEIYVIGVTNQVNTAELQGMSSPPQAQNRNWWMTMNFAELDHIVVDIAYATCYPDQVRPVGKCSFL